MMGGASRIQKTISTIVLVAFVNLIAIEHTFAAPGIVTLERGPNYTSGAYRERVADLSVKVLGGEVAIEREWDAREQDWVFHPRWQDLAFKGSGSTLIIVQGEVEYKPDETNSGRFLADGGRTITSNAEGFRWEGINRDWIQYDAPGRVLAFGDAFGTMLELTRDTSGRVAGVLDANGVLVLSVAYDPGTGAVASVSDHSGRSVQYGYQSNRLDTVTDARGQPWSYGYSGSGALSQISDPRGAVTQVDYDAAGERVKSVSAGGITTEYQYGYNDRKKEHYFQSKIAGSLVEERWIDTTGLLARSARNGKTIRSVTRDAGKRHIKDRNGAVTTHTLASSTRSVAVSTRTITGTRRPRGGVRSFDVDSAKRRVRGAISPRNIGRTHTFDSKNQVIGSVQGVGTPRERSSAFEYDSYGQVKKARSLKADGSVDRQISVDYDGFGNASRVALSSGVAADASYDASGNVTSLTDGVGSDWGFEYDAAGNVTKVIDPLDREVVYEYDEVGNLFHVVEADGGEYFWEYNERDQVTKVTGSLGEVWVYEYDERGNLARTSHPVGLFEEFGYDNENRPTRYRSVGGDEYQLSYLDGQTDENPRPGPEIRIAGPSSTQVFQFDEEEQLIGDHFVLPDQSVAAGLRFGYDLEGNVTEVVDANDHSVEIEYDEHDRPKLVRTADGGETRFEASGWGDVLTITDATGNATVVERKEADGRIEVTREGGRTAAYQFDDAAQLTEYLDRNGNRVVQDFDVVGRLERVQIFDADAPGSPRTITFAHDVVGNMVSYDDGTTSGSYEYDLAGHLTAETTNYGPFSLTHRYTYDGIGRITSYTAPDGTVYAYEYSAQGDLSRLEIPAVGAVTYNSYREGEPTKVTYPGGMTSEYEYDYRLRLTASATKDPAGNSVAELQVARDPAGNVTGLATEQGTHAYAYDNVNRLVSATHPQLPAESYFYDQAGNRLPADAAERATWQLGVDNRIESTGSTTYEYDAHGNRTRRAGAADEQQYEYDAAGRLVRVRDSGGNEIVSYHYDPFGRRLWKEVGGARTYLHYNSQGLAGEYASDGAAIREYGYAPDGSWFSDPVFQRSGSSYYYYENDHLGAPRRLLSGGGATVWSAQYEAYGRAHVQVGSVESNLRLPGQFFDAETGLHYNNQRTYDPALGVYLEPDPMGAFGALHLYHYAADNPTTKTDPSGLILPALAAVGAVALFALWAYGVADALLVQVPIVFNDCCSLSDRTKAAFWAALSLIPGSALAKLARPFVRAGGPLARAAAASVRNSGAYARAAQLGARLRGAGAAAARGVAARARALANAARAARAGGAGAAGAGARVGYHATTPSAAAAIRNSALNPSARGRLGGGGQYVNDTPEGAIAEYRFNNPGGPEPEVLRVRYDPGLEYHIPTPPARVTEGALPLAADTLTTPSLREPGTLNTIIRNESAKVLD